MAGDKDHFAEPKPDGFELRLSLLYATLFVPNAVHLAFFPLWLRDHGLTSVEISTLLAAPVLVRIFATPPVTFYADRSPERAHVMIAVSALSLFLSLFLALDMAFSGLFVLMCLMSAAWSPQVPLADSIALSGVRRFGVEFAAIRIWGSVAFLVVNIGAGLAIERFSSAVVPPMIMASFASVLLAACFMPRLGRRRLLSDAGPVPAGSKLLRRPSVLMFFDCHRSHPGQPWLSVQFWLDLLEGKRHQRRSGRISLGRAGVRRDCPVQLLPPHFRQSSA